MGTRMTRMQANADKTDFQKSAFIRVWHICVIRVPIKIKGVPYFGASAQTVVSSQASKSFFN